jgi:putative phosphoesterase
MLAVVLSDTHVRRGGTRRLPDAAYAALDRADVVLHAGDVLIPELLDELRGFAPVHAVLGNNDHELVGRLPESIVVDIDGVEVAMIHDSGPRAGRAGRLRRRFPSAAVVVFGHSHLPCNEPGVDGQLLFNPGSPTERRMAPTRTIGMLELRRGRVHRAEIVDV